MYKGPKMIVGNNPIPLNVPHEPDNIIIIRNLSGFELDEAQEIASDKALKKYTSMREFMDTVSDDDAAQRRAQEMVSDGAQPVRDIKLDYDKEYCITNSIIGWSGPNYDGVELNHINKCQLDKSTNDWLFDLIIKRNVVTQGESVTSVP